MSEYGRSPVEIIEDSVLSLMGQYEIARRKFLDVAGPEPDWDLLLEQEISYKGACAALSPASRERDALLDRLETWISLRADPRAQWVSAAYLAVLDAG